MGIAQSFKDRKKLAIFLTTHYLEEAEDADNIFILEKGQIIEHGSAQLLKQKYGQRQLQIIVDDAKEAMHKFLKKDYKVELISPTQLSVRIDNKDQAISFLSDHGRDNVDFLYEPIELTDIFLQLTGRNLNHESNH